MKPVLSILLAVIITFILLIILKVFYLSTYSNLFPVLVVYILVGGLVTWISTENKIRYSLYYGIIFAAIYGVHRTYSMTLIVPLLAVMGGSIAKNEKGTVKNFLDNKFQGKYKSFFINLYKRNKIFLLASSIIFFASLIIGGIGPYLSSSFNIYMTNVTTNYLSVLKSITKVDTLSIFLNNSTVAFLYMYISGISFGIISIIKLAQMGLIDGFLFTKYPYAIFYILPHGIFEYLSSIISVAAGFKLLSTVINITWAGLHIKRDKSIVEQVSGIFSVNYLKFRDSMVLMVIAIALFAIAAIIEANITLPFAQYMINLIYH
jgi:stage II sporulation protein M